ncbi:MAG TPA: hypothetical protein VFX49_20710, partial [Chloroflexota bacterium]|nr:hypothetical protein [Chloroflexota bacterium]
KPPPDPEGAFVDRWTTRAPASTPAPAPEAQPATAPDAETIPLERVAPPPVPEPVSLAEPPIEAEPEAAPAARRSWRESRAVDLAVRTLAWLLALVVLGAAGWLAWWLIVPQLPKPFVYDEAAFAFAGHAVAQSGAPLSNVGHMQAEVPGDFSKRFNWALWHPPLYVFTLGWAFGQWGESEQTARLVGVACNALAALFAFLTGVVALWGRTRAAPLYSAIGTALYLTNPYVIQSALLLDIDGTVLVASIALLALLYTVLLRAPLRLRSPWTWLLLGMTTAAFGLSMWAKMTTAFALPAGAALYRLFATRPWRPWRALIELPVIPVLGGALFVATWWLACQRLGMPFLLPFQILQHELRDAAGSTSGWRENPRILLELVSYVALWVSPYLVFLFVWAGAARLTDLVVGPFVVLGRRLLRRPAAGEPWGAWAVDFSLVCGAAIGAAYLIKLAASFPKYHISMMPFWAVGIGYLLFRYVKRVAWWEPAVYAVSGAGMAGYFSSFVGDKFVLFRGFDFVYPLLVFPATLGFAFLVLCAALGRHHLPRQLTVLLLLLTLAWSWGVNSAQRGATYSTAYNYGSFGQEATARRIDSITRPGQPYIGSRDVAYYARNQLYVDQDTFWEHIARLDTAGIKTFDGRIAGYDRVDVAALFLWDPELGRLAHTYLDDRYEVDFQEGPFLIFVRTSP